MLNGVGEEAQRQQADMLQRSRHGQQPDIQRAQSKALNERRHACLRLRVVPGEEHVQRVALGVAETVYKGNIRDWGKTKKSLTVIHIPKELADDLQAWRNECEERALEAAAKDKTKSPFLSPDDFIFANEAGGFLDTDNFRKRVLHKLARDLKLSKLTFQVIRRTIATLAQKKGTVRDVLGVMRHSRTATTTDVYMQKIPATENYAAQRQRGGKNRHRPAAWLQVGAKQFCV